MIFFLHSLQQPQGGSVIHEAITVYTVENLGSSERASSYGLALQKGQFFWITNGSQGFLLIKLINHNKIHVGQKHYSLEIIPHSTSLLPLSDRVEGSVSSSADTGVPKVTEPETETLFVVLITSGFILKGFRRSYGVSLL